MRFTFRRVLQHLNLKVGTARFPGSFGQHLAPTPRLRRCGIDGLQMGERQFRLLQLFEVDVPQRAMQKHVFGMRSRAFLQRDSRGAIVGHGLGLIGMCLQSPGGLQLSCISAFDRLIGRRRRLPARKKRQGEGGLGMGAEHIPGDARGLGVPSPGFEELGIRDVYPLVIRSDLQCVLKCLIGLGESTGLIQSIGQVEPAPLIVRIPFRYFSQHLNLKVVPARFPGSFGQHLAPTRRLRRCGIDGLQMGERQFRLLQLVEIQVTQRLVQRQVFGMRA